MVRCCGCILLLFLFFLSGCTGSFNSSDKDDILRTAPENSKLNFSTHPSNTITDTAFINTIEVQLLDEKNELISNFNGPVTLSIETDPSGSAELLGDLVVNAINGVAVFDNLSINKKGLGFTFSVSSGVAEKATSNSFDVSQKIYRSVGADNTIPLSCGSTIIDCTGNGETISFLNSVISFSAAVPTNVGVGDVVVWDSNASTSLNTGDSVGIIHKRLSSTSFQVRTTSGDEVTSSYSGLNWAILRAYTSINNAIDSTNGGTENTAIAGLVGAANANFDSYTGGKDLTISNEQLNFAVYADTRMASATTMNTGWSADSTRFVRIYTPYLSSEVGVSQRHNGYYDKSKELLDNTGTANNSLVIHTSYTIVDGLTVTGRETIFQAATGSDEITFSNNLIFFSPVNVAQRAAIDLNSDVAGKFYIYNNIIAGESGSSVGIYNASTTAFTAYVYHNTVYGVDIGLDNSGSANFELKNNIFSSNVTADIQTCGCSVSANNITSDATSPDNGSFDNVSLNFKSSTGYDFRLDKTNDLEAIDQGVDLSDDNNLTALKDILGFSRGIGAGWDIGAFESYEYNFSDIVKADFDLGSFTRTESSGSDTVSMMAYTESQRELQSGDSLFNANLIGLWSGNGTLGVVADATTIVDLSGTGNDLTTSDGATDNTMNFVTGKLNQAIQFDGTDDYASSPNVEIPANYSVAFWFKNDLRAPDATPTQPFSWNSSNGQGIRFSWGDGTAGNRQAWTLYYGVTDTLQYSAPLEQSKWYHIAVTYDGTDLKTYLNGSLDQSLAVGPAIDTGSDTVNIGAGAGGTTSFSDGTIDEIAVWNTDLTNAEVNSLYESQKATYVNKGTASFVSRVFNSGSDDNSWKKFSPIPKAPYGKEIASKSESEYTESNVSLTNIVGIWHLNEASGTIYDSSGNGNHSTTVGGTPDYNQIGKFKGSLKFDGTSDYVHFGTGPSMSGTTDFTISLWVKTTNDGANGKNGMSLVQQRDPGWDNGEYLINIGKDYNGGDPHPGQVLFVVWEDGGPQVSSFWSYKRVDDGQWHHITAVREGLTLRIYIDGVLDREETGAGPLDNLNAGNVTVFGRDELFEDRFFEGEMDEVAIWSRALSTSEVVSLYKRGALRLKYQVSNCDLSNCSDGSFIGPDGTSSSYFSEISGQGSAIENYYLFGNSSSRYFQYKVIFESDDSFYTPELKNVYIFSE